MKITNALTLAQLKLNKKRTLVTILGVVISVAMITAVSTIYYSFSDWYLRSAIATSGDYHVEYSEVDAKNAAVITSDSNTQDYFLSKDLGYAPLDDSKIPYKPYMFIKAYDDAAFSGMNVSVIEGELPKNGGELAITRELLRAAGGSLELNDTIDVGLCERIFEDGSRLLASEHYYVGEDGEPMESLSPTGEQRRFKIVGIIESTGLFNSTPQSLALTRLESPEGLINISVKLKSVTPAIYEQSVKLAGAAGIEPMPGYDLKDYINTNSEVLRASGVTGYESINTTIFMFALILVAIIAVGSISLIYNAFSISVSERSRYLGMLASVGATKKQKRDSVFFEGMVIGSISIPIGVAAGLAGIGLTLALLAPLITTVAGSGKDIPLIMVVSPTSIAIAVLLSALTIFISILAPARRASRISPIDAIRQSRDIKITRRDVKTSRLTKKLFGFEGVLAIKNLKRNKKRYNAVVFSLITAIVLFLSVSSFTSMFYVAGEYTESDVNFDVMVSAYMPGGNDYDKTMEVFEGILSLGVDDYAIQSTVSAYTDAPKTGKYNEVSGDDDSVTLIGMDDASFNRYVSSLGLNAPDFNGDNFAGVLMNTVTVRQEDKFTTTSALEADAGDVLNLELMDYAGAKGDEAPERVARQIEISAVTDSTPIGYSQRSGTPGVVMPQSALDKFVDGLGTEPNMVLFITTGNPELLVDRITEYADNFPEFDIYSYSEAVARNAQRNTATFMNVFAYGFIALISLVCIANIINTISTGVSLRKREFAMLKSVGMTKGSFSRMLRFESMFYGLKSLIYGLPISAVVLALLYAVLSRNLSFEIPVPWGSVIAACAAVFAVVGVTMLYSSAKVRRENIVDALKDENG